MPDDKNTPVEHIFGAIDQPQNAALWLKDRLTGLHHYSRKAPLTPMPGEEVELTVTASVGQPYEAVYLWYTVDEWQTFRKIIFSRGQLVWNSVLWSYLQEWKVTLPPQSEGVMLRYKIGGKVAGSDSFVFADQQKEALADATNYAIWYGKRSNPDWARRARVYQVFVDRFDPGQGQAWFEKDDLRKPFGGTLRGIIERLPAIKSMGFNTIWLTPIFASPSHHGYDITDYFQINPRVGTLNDLKTLLKEAHRLEIRVLLDFVANHCSNEHPYFQDALQDSESPYHDWFLWEQWPKYECFYNILSMPKINLRYGSPARAHLLEAAQYWLKMGVDGLRLDYANGPEHDFWVDFRQACMTVKEDAWTFGEVVQPPDVQATYGDGLGGTLDFLLCQALRATFGQQTWSLSKFAGFIDLHFKYFPSEFSLPAFIDNHDMDRFYKIAGNDLRRLKLGLLILYVLPGPPIVYYGTEAPLSQNKLIHDVGAMGFDESRLAMSWEALERSTLPAYLKIMSDMRVQNLILMTAEWQTLVVDDERQLLILGTNQREYLLIINVSEAPAALSVTVDRQCRYIDPIAKETYSDLDGKLKVLVQPVSGMLLSRQVAQHV